MRGRAGGFRVGVGWVKRAGPGQVGGSGGGVAGEHREMRQTAGNVSE